LTAAVQPVPAGVGRRPDDPANRSLPPATRSSSTAGPPARWRDLTGL